MFDMALLEVFFDPPTEEWVVDDGQREIGARDTKQAAVQLAKSTSQRKDTIQVETRDGRLESEMINGPDGFVKAGIDTPQPKESNQQSDSGGLGGLGGGGGLPGMGGDNGGGLF